MLVLTRRPGETVRLGDEVVIEVVRVEHERVILGFTAPAHVRILRGELVDAVAEEVRRARTALSNRRRQGRTA